MAAGLDEATWTLVPKNEWDVAAGTALVEASGGRVFVPVTGEPPPFNQRDTRLPGLVALTVAETRSSRCVYRGE